MKAKHYTISRDKFGLTLDFRLQSLTLMPFCVV